MENVPVEVLEQIFTNLTSLKDIGNCMQICQKWKNILTVMIKDRFNQNVKVLVITGKPEENGAKIEVIDLIDPKWKHVGAFHIRGYSESQLSRTSGSTGAIYNDKVIICGGTSGWRSVCISLENRTKSFTYFFDGKSLSLHKQQYFFINLDELFGNK